MKSPLASKPEYMPFLQVGVVQSRVYLFSKYGDHGYRENQYNF